MNNLFTNYTKILILSLILSLPNIVLAKSKVNNYLTLDIDFTSDYIYASSNKDKNKKNKFNYINSYNIDSNIFILRSDYFDIKTIQGIRLLSSSVYEDKHNLLYNINLGAELGSQYIGYVGAGYDRLLADKMFINYDNAIDWRYYYKDSSGQSIQDYQFAKVYYKSPRLLNFALHAEFAMHDKNIDNNKVLSNKTKVSVIDNIAGIDIFNMQSLNNSKYFNYRKLSDQESAYVFDAGLNYKFNDSTINDLRFEADLSVIYAEDIKHISQQKLSLLNSFLALDKDILTNKVNDFVIKVNSSFVLDWDINTLVLDSINIRGVYSIAMVNMAQFAYEADDNINISDPSASIVVPPAAIVPPAAAPTKPDLYEWLNRYYMFAINQNKMTRNFRPMQYLDMNEDIQGIGGAQGFVNQFILQDYYDAAGQTYVAKNAVILGKAKYCDSCNTMNPKTVETIEQQSLEVFHLLSKATTFAEQQHIDAYYDELDAYENYIPPVELAAQEDSNLDTNSELDLANSKDIKTNKIYNFIRSKTNHHFVNGSIKLEKFGFFINASANYMFGKHAMYKNNSAELIKYNVLRTSASVGYEFKDLIVASDSLNLYINSYYNSKEFIDKDSEYIFGMGIRYDL